MRSVRETFTSIELDSMKTTTPRLYRDQPFQKSTYQLQRLFWAINAVLTSPLASSLLTKMPEGSDSLARWALLPRTKHPSRRRLEAGHMAGPRRGRETKEGRESMCVYDDVKQEEEELFSHHATRFQTRFCHFLKLGRQGRGNVCVCEETIFFNIYITKTTKIVCDSHSHHPPTRFQTRICHFFEIIGRVKSSIWQKSRIHKKRN